MKLIMYETDSHQIKLYDTIEVTELESASAAAKRLGQLLEDLTFGDCAKTVLEEFYEACRLISAPYQLLHRRIEQRAKAFLSEFSILLNHWEKKSTHEGAEKHGLFKKLTHQSYDSCPEYGFVYNLRNHAVHGGTVVSRIHGEIGCQYIQPLANRDRLLSDYRKWKPNEIDFLLQQPEYFDLYPIFQKAYSVIQSLHYYMMDAQLTTQTIADCDLLTALHHRMLSLNSEPGSWDIIEFFDCHGDPCNLSDIAAAKFKSCSRCHSTWNAYPIIKSRAEMLLHSQTK